MLVVPNLRVVEPNNIFRKVPTRRPNAEMRTRRGILDVACIVRHVRSCLQHNRCGGNHPRLEGGELGVGHIAEPFRDRIGGKMQIQRLRWAAITAVEKRRRRGVACRIRVAVLCKFNQCINCQTREPTGLDH